MTTFRWPGAIASLPIEPMGGTSLHDLKIALEAVRTEAGSFSVVDYETLGVLLVEAHSLRPLEIVVDAITKRGTGFRLGNPSILYLEWLSRPASADYIHPALFDEREIKISLSLGTQNPSLENIIEIDQAVEASLSYEMRAALLQAVSTSLREGPLVGMPVVGAQVRIATFETLHATAHTIELAIAQAMKAASGRGVIMLAEPIMDVEVSIPGEYTGSVLVDLNAKRGFIERQTASGDRVTVEASAPLACLFGYTSELKAMTNATGLYTTAYKHHQVLSRDHWNPDTFSPAAAMRA